MRTFRPDQEAKLVVILRTRSAQIGVQPAAIDGQFDGQIGSLSRPCRGAKRKGWRVVRVEGKVKGTEAVLLQLPAGSADAATCRLLDRLTFASLARKCRPDRRLKQEEVMITEESKVKVTQWLSLQVATA